jgi:hypothetical protein
VFFIRSEEILPCPCCGGRLFVIGSRKRGIIDSSGSRIKLKIRRLCCDDCGKIHHELPNDLIVPYKRYNRESVENSLTDHGLLNVAADESTIARWRSWFMALMVYFAGCIEAIDARFNIIKEQSCSTATSPLQRIWQYTGDAAGWLAKLVRPLVNLNLWLQTRSAFLSER